MSLDAIKTAVVTAVEVKIKESAEVAVLALATVEAGLEAKADATVVAALEAKNAEQVEVIAAQAAQIKSVESQVEEVKNIAADLEAKVKSAGQSVHTETNAVGFDIKALNGALRNAFAKKDAQTDLSTIDTKTLSIAGAGDAQLAIDEELGRTILERARESVMILQLIGSKSVSSVDYREMVLRMYPTAATGTEQTGTSANGDIWALTGTPTYVSVAMTVAKQYSKPLISDEAIADPAIDLYAHCQALLAEETARYWATQVLFGAGTSGQLRGILHNHDTQGRLDIVESINHNHGTRNVEYYPVVISGVADGVGDQIVAIDTAIDMSIVVPSAYLGNSKYVMNRRTLGLYRKLRDGFDRPLIQWEAGNFTLQGYSVAIEDYMPNVDGTVSNVTVGSTPFPVIFGDLSKAFALCSIDDKFLIDPYSADGGVMLKYTSRKGDIVQNNDAIVVLRTTADWV
jgi:HK97 family phage major capsid protein